MSDEIDRTQERDQQFREHALGEQRRRADHLRLPAIGACHYCGEPVLDARRFCGPECRDDWDHEQARRRAAGGA
ncbi:MAG TPA: hypothetical protein PLW81_06140 [Thiobacillaceae bacterium]|nr:hypothetical protein [Thiobacillaceae bacterium]